MSTSCNVLLITGIPGIGKTTIVKKAFTSLSGLNIGGFYTEEIRINNVRQGFELVTFQGKRLVMAHIDSDSAYRVGKYGVDVDAIDTAVAMTMSEDRNTELFIIDEIGKMECFSDLFVKRMSSLLDSGKPVVATIALKGGGFISEVKNRAGVKLWEATKKNRNDMPDKIASWVRENPLNS
jgi:nucleoside-triphosphatase